MHADLLETPLLLLSPGADGTPERPAGDPWTIRDACEGVAIFGAAGSGKTSGSGRALAHKFLTNGFGGLVLTAKQNECELWRSYCRDAGRSKDLVIVDANDDDPPWRFNFLDYEMNRSGRGAGRTENLVELFITVAEKSSSSGKGISDQAYWEGARRQLLRNAIEALKLAEVPLTLDNVHDVILTAPRDREEVQSDEWQARSLCAQSLVQGLERVHDTPREHDWKKTFDYWTQEFPGYSDNLRASIVSMFTTIADAFSRGALHRLFCTDTTITPDLTFGGKILVIDLPADDFEDIGVMAQTLFKLLWQRAVMHRRVDPETKPVFLWADEAQEFVTEQDPRFQQKAREQRGCAVYLSQNLPNYKFALGSDDAVNALLSNFQTKIFHANTCPETNRWAAEHIAQHWETRSSYSQNAQGESTTISRDLQYLVGPHEFTRLRTGGPRNDFEVEAILLKTGRIWNRSDAPHVPITFRQSRETNKPAGIEFDEILPAPVPGIELGDQVAEPGSIDELQSAEKILPIRLDIGQTS